MHGDGEHTIVRYVIIFGVLGGDKMRYLILIIILIEIGIITWYLIPERPVREMMARPIELCERCGHIGYSDKCEVCGYLKQNYARPYIGDFTEPKFRKAR